jgi:hypothetical protein
MKFFLLHGTSSQIDSTEHVRIDEELERDFVQHGKKDKCGMRVVGIVIFTSAKTGDWGGRGSFFQPLGDALSYCQSLKRQRLGSA